MSTILHIKNMVCPRCIETVSNLLVSEGFCVESIKLGEVEIDRSPTEEQVQLLADLLTEKGFELIHDRKSRIVEQVKTLIIDWIHHDSGEMAGAENLSLVLSKSLGMDYSVLSHTFSATAGLTIEKYAILQKIEKVKELLSYGELTTSEIAYKMGYSSAAHLSSQFKKETGMTPGQFKNLGDKVRKPLDSIGN